MCGDYELQAITALSPTIRIFEPTTQELSSQFNEISSYLTGKRVTDYSIVNEDVIPYCVDNDYGFDPTIRRKHNMRELVETLSG